MDTYNCPAWTPDRYLFPPPGEPCCSVRIGAMRSPRTPVEDEGNARRLAIAWNFAGF
jgi:hypothetical protein